MNKITASNLVSAINQLDKNVSYRYVNPKNNGMIKICSVSEPEGPIKIKRWKPSEGESESNVSEESISTEMIWRIANALNPYQPINLERVLGASYNTRSVFEALIAHTPQFCYCRPQRLESTGGRPVLKAGHKYIIWTPENPHANGKLTEFSTDIVVSEVAVNDAYYGQLTLPDSTRTEGFDLDSLRRHAQIQVALYFIGKQLGFKTWIAQNDRGIIYDGKRIAQYEGVIDSLSNEKVIQSHIEAIKAALHIDCIWFKNGRLVPAVIEVEHSTGVTTGLSRMKNFQDKMVPIEDMRFVIAAPDEDRQKVIQEASKDQFKSLKTRFFPYSAVEELYALCTKRKIRGVNQEFLDSYLEPIIASKS